MSRSAMRRNTTRTLLFALMVQGFATACDLKSPVEPDTMMGVPDHVSYGLTPSGIAASTVSWSQIDISWARTPSATEYQLFRADGPTGSYTFLTRTSATVISYSNTGLTGSTEYCYQVRAIKTAGKNTTYSAFSSAACATTFPPPVAAPSETEAVPQGYAILVRWRDNSANEEGFRIERAPAPSGPWQNVTSASANATSTYSYVVWNEPACFRVIAFNSLGSSLPSTPDCTTPPAPPSELMATADAQGITLTWKDNSAFEDGYRITRRDQNGAETELVTLPASAQSYRDASATPDVTYTYVVQATKDGGYSPTSNGATSVVATSAPAAPTYAYGYFYWDYEGYYGWNYLIISWGDNSTNEEGFRIEYSPNGSDGWTEYATSSANTGYYEQPFDAYGPPPPPACYRVRSLNSAGTSSPSNVICVEPLGAPTDLGATAVDQQTIDLAWTDNASIETGYVVIRSTTYDGVYEKVATLSANATTHRDGGLASGQEYWYLVYATYPDGGWGQSSSYAAATTTVAGAAPQASGTRVVTRPAPTGPVRVRGVEPRKRVAPIRERKR